MAKAKKMSPAEKMLAQVQKFEVVMDTKGTVEGAYISNVKSIKVQKSDTPIVYMSGRKTPTQINGIFFVSKYSPIGFVIVTDSKGTYTIPKHLIGDAIADLLDSGKLTHYSHYPTMADKDTQTKIDSLLKKFKV